MCDGSSDNPSFTQIDDFQITTFEIENKNLNEVVENMVIELDFNSFEGEKLDLNFDLPFSENLNSLQNSNDFECNPCQFNFKLQNEFQTQHENGNNFSNEFGNWE